MSHSCPASVTASVSATRTSGGHVKGAVFELFTCGALIQRTTSMDGCAAAGDGCIHCVISAGPDPRETVTTLIAAEGWQVAA